MTKRGSAGEADSQRGTHSTAELDASARASAALSARVQQYPYRTLGLGLGLGLVIGAGMWKVLARSMLGVGVQFAAAVAVPPMIVARRSRPPEA